MTNVIPFNGERQVVTVAEIVECLQKAIAEGRVKHLMFVTMAENTDVKVAMTTIPAHCAVYMNNLQRLSIEKLMAAGEMIP